MPPFSFRSLQIHLTLITILVIVIMSGCVPIPPPPSDEAQGTEGAQASEEVPAADEAELSEEPLATEEPESTGEPEEDDSQYDDREPVGKIEAELWDILRLECDNCDYNVVVLLKEPETMQQIRDAADEFGQGSDRVIDLVGALQEEIAAQQSRVLDAVNSNGIERFRVDIQYAAVPVMIGIANEEAINILEDLHDVERVGVDIGDGDGDVVGGESDVAFDGVEAIGADSWHEMGIMGNGVTIAVLDSGFDGSAPDLQSGVSEEACFLDFSAKEDQSGHCPNDERRQFGPGSTEDIDGHGTFVTGILTSDGSASPMGVVPAAEIISIKVLDSEMKFFTFSEIVAALDYIITQTQASEMDIDIINMSVGSNRTFKEQCDDEHLGSVDGAKFAIETLREMGIITFAATGNGSKKNRMIAPACISFAVGVGATDTNGLFAALTNRSSMLDLLAPGMGITSIGFNGIPQDGTSFATPYAVGCAALYISAGIATTPDKIEAALINSGNPVTLPDGRVVPGLNCLHP